MTSRNSISFIMPCFNCSDSVEESVVSILETNINKQDEIILINDQSTDQTHSIINRLLKKYHQYNLKILEHRVHKGSAAAGRNTGIENSQNNLIFCLDADNILEKNSIPKLKSFLLSEKADAASFGALYFFTRKTKNVTHKWIFKEGQITLADSLSGNYWPGPSGNYLFTKKSWLNANRYDESLFGAYDSWAFGIQQLATGTKMVTLPNTYYFHRYSHNSAFIRDKRKINSSLLALRVLLPYLKIINSQDLEYIFSKTHRLEWFDRLNKRPIRLAGLPIGKNGTVKYEVGQIAKELVQKTFFR